VSCIVAGNRHIVDSEFDNAGSDKVYRLSRYCILLVGYYSWTKEGQLDHSWTVGKQFSIRCLSNSDRNMGAINLYNVFLGLEMAHVLQWKPSWEMNGKRHPEEENTGKLKLVSRNGIRDGKTSGF
jgi:hypothetical protein